MKRFIKRISLALIIVLLLQISLFGQTSMLKPAEAAVSGPIIVSMSPTDNSISSSINSTLSFTFDEAIKIGTGSETIKIYENSKNILFESFLVTSPNVVVSGDGRTVTITPSKLFEDNTEYYVLIEHGSFSNVSNGAIFRGITDKTVWNFKTIAAIVAAPTGTISINSGAAYTNSTSVSLNITASDPNSDPVYMSFSNDETTWSSWETLSSTKSWILSDGDGVKTVYMKLKDSTGEISVVYSDAITLDTIPPVITGVTKGGEYNHNVTITFNEGIARLSGSLFTSGSTISLEGTYIIVVTDNAGNTTTVNFSIDKTSPTVQGVMNGEAYNGDKTITFSDGMATVNGSTFTSGQTISLEGTYTLVVTDSASNSTKVNFSIDKTSPTVQGVRNGEAYNVDKTITFSDGTATLNGNPFISGLIVSGEGTYTLVVIDIASNSTRLNFAIDKTAPQGSISILNGATTTNTTSVTLNLTGTDANSFLMQFSNDGSNWSTAEPFTPYKAWTLESGVGTKTVYYKLTDRAGNSSLYSDTIILNVPLNSNADLNSITFSKGTLTPTFAPNILSYTMSVASQVSSIDLQPTAEFNKATLKVDGVDVISGNNKTISLSHGANTITIEVTAEDGITNKKYTVTVNRAKPSNPGPSSPEPVNPVPVQPENPTPVKAIPNTTLPNPHGLPVATLTVNEDIKLYQLDDAGNLVQAKLVGKGASLLVYDIYKGYYKLANNLYAIPSPFISAHIGKGEVRKEEVSVYDKDGRFLRTIKKGQEYKVYSYDDNRYAIGGGEFIEVQDGVTYVFGWITLIEPMTLYKADGTIERILQVGEKYRIYSAHKDALHLGGGYTVKRKNSMYTFVKN